jgi:hypothetical protein
MTDFDTIELILDHADNQGLTDESYIEHLYTLNSIELAAELDRLETIAVYGGF